MLTETETVGFMDDCNKLQCPSPTQLSELIKRFDSKFKQKKDVPRIKSREPPKMKLRDVHEVLEIARLKVLASEMREKAVKMEARLNILAAEKCDEVIIKSHNDKKNNTDPQDVVNTNADLEDFKSNNESQGVKKTNKESQDVKKTNKDNSLDVKKIIKDLQDVKNNNIEELRDVENINKDLQDVKHNNIEDLRVVDKFNKDLMDRTQGDNANMGIPDVECVKVDATAQGDVCNSKDLQDFKKDSKDLFVKQKAELDKDAENLHAQIENLQLDVDKMLLELSEKPHLEKELASAKERIKGLQEEIKDDAVLTKAQLLLLKQQFGELEDIEIGSAHKELKFRKVSSLEAEVADMKNSNKELLKHKQELSKKLHSVLKRAEKMTPITKNDVLASEAEVSNLRSTNVELQKKVESLQISRFNEVEELVYLRWVNACLRHDLDTYKASRRNSEDILVQSKKCSPSLHGKDEGDPMSCTNSGRSFASYSDAHGYPASENGDEGIPPSYEGSTKSSPRIAITHSHVNSSHSSPIATKHDQVNSRHTSPLAITYAHVNSSHTSPQYVQRRITKTKSGPLVATQQHSPSHAYLSRSPEACNPCQVSPEKAAVQRDPQRISDIRTMLTFNDRMAISDATSCMTTLTSNSPRRSGRSFNRSASNVSSSSEPLINRMQSSPQKQNMRRFMRSSSTLSSESDISITSQNKKASLLRRHSASSGTSTLLDEYLHSTDTRSLNRPTSRFSAVLPHDRRFSDSASVPFPTIKEGADLSMRKEHTGMKAYSFESQLDASDRVVAAFQVLCASTHTNNTHPTFKDLSRRNSLDDKAVSNADDQSTDEHYSSDNAHMPSAKSTQADFFRDLARAIQATHYKSIDKVAAFVYWFDRQGHEDKKEFFNLPDCPKDKVEAMRRAVYEYEELQALETNLKSYQDNLQSPESVALKEMENLLEMVENHIQGFRQAREMAIAQFIELEIPTHWMLDSEIIAKIKRASLKVAQQYIKRVTTVLNALGHHRTESETLSRDDMLRHAARFLLQIHNFAGGFDENTANAFNMLQSQVDLRVNNVACCSVNLQ